MAALALAVLLPAPSLAQQKQVPSAAQPQPAPGGLKVVVTIGPVHSIAAAVMAGIGEPVLLLKGSASPHSYAMKPSDAKAISGAHVVVRVSLGLETFMGKVVSTLPRATQVVTLDTVPGMSLLPVRAGGGFEDDGHGHGSGGKHGHGHDHGPAKKGAAAAMDGHLWLDPDNAKRIAVHLASVLAGKAPHNADRLKANAEAFSRHVDALAREIAESIRPVAGRPFIVFHDAYQYFEARFGLKALGSITVSPDVQSGARRIGQIRDKIKANAATCVFAEPQFEPKLMATLTEGTGARTGVLDPLGAALTPGPELYPELLRELAKSLKTCLGGTS